MGLQRRAFVQSACPNSTAHSPAGCLKFKYPCHLDDDVVSGVCCPTWWKISQYDVNFPFWPAWLELDGEIRVLRADLAGFFIKMQNNHITSSSSIPFVLQAVWNEGTKLRMPIGSEQSYICDFNCNWRRRTLFAIWLTTLSSWCWDLVDKGHLW